MKLCVGQLVSQSSKYFIGSSPDLLPGGRLSLGKTLATGFFKFPQR